MKNPLKRIAVTVAATAALSVVIPVSSAAAMNRTDCGNRTDFVKLTKLGGKESLCFANAGEQNVKIYQVGTVEAGNNSVSITIDGHTYDIDPGRSLKNVDTDGTVTWIKIH